ncbi:MAG: putative phosphatase MPN_427 [Tenericutes bacterium ADurb.Bin239]|nr:MAG: putative phosphatase MPN_427 [Tenericutes bacterium ADurb.Bin239]
MGENYKLLATDLDGTLFYPKRPVSLISKKNKRFLNKFIDEGNKVVLVTGRSPDFTKRVFEVLGREVDVIGMNGAYTIIDGQIKDEHFLDFHVEEMLYDLNTMFPILGSMLISQKYPLLISTPPVGKFIEIFYHIYYKLMGRYAEDYHFSNEEFLKEIKSKHVYKIMLFFGISRRGERKAAEANRYLRKHYPDQFEASWTGGFIEITPAGVSKANGIKAYAEAKNISAENVYVVGDSGNDISMFNAFYERSFCMKHSHKKVKKYAKTIIRRFHHLEKYL